MFTIHRYFVSTPLILALRRSVPEKSGIPLLLRLLRDIGGHGNFRCFLYDIPLEPSGHPVDVKIATYTGAKIEDGE
jgi:hypothetical protein